ncbi:HNH endonuclease [bacterium]|nr:HNH endonuclease [bacterium]
MDALTPAQRSVHNNFLISVQTLKRSLLRTIYYLGQIKEQNIHRHMGYRSISDYALAHSGLTATQTKEFLYLARRLPEYPHIATALANGSLSWGQAREICGSVGPEEQVAWIDIARSLPRQQLRAALKSEIPQAFQGTGVDVPHGRESGQGVPSMPNPTDPQERVEARSLSLGDAASNRPPTKGADDWEYVTLRFDQEQFARWEAFRGVADSEATASREDQILDGLEAVAMGTTAESPDSRMPPYLIVLIRCPKCGTTRLIHSRGEVEPGLDLLAAAHCDAVVEAESRERRRTIAPRIRRAVLARARYRCEAAGCSSTRFLEVHHRSRSAHGGTDSAENLVVLCWRCHRELHRRDKRAREAVVQAP